MGRMKTLRLQELQDRRGRETQALIQTGWTCSSPGASCGTHAALLPSLAVAQAAFPAMDGPLHWAFNIPAHPTRRPTCTASTRNAAHHRIQRRTTALPSQDR